MKIKLIFACALSIGLFICPAVAQFKIISGKKFSRAKEIRKFDFLNATYESCVGGKVKVRNGKYSPGSFGFEVLVSYGDLTGDNIEEAIVVTQCSGAVQNLDEGKIYAVKNHRLIKLAELEQGTKFGGILSAVIKRGLLVVTRGPSPDLCTDVENAAEEIATFRLLKNNRLQQIGKSICKPI